MKAAMGVAGVNHLADSLADNISRMISGKEEWSTGVKVTRDKENSPVIDISVVADYGSKIPQLAWDIQTAVKDNVFKISGERVSAVNIHVQGVTLAKTAGRRNEQKSRQRACHEVCLSDGSSERI